jgi:IclR family acetate operon transcriptional repressor
LKAFALLSSFNSEEEWLSSAELSRRAKLPGASGYRLLQTLEKAGAVIRSARGRYRPSVVLSFGRVVDERVRLRDLSDDILEDLAGRLRLTAHLGVLEDSMVTYIAKRGDQKRFPVHTEVGAQLEAYCSGLGKVLLSALPQDAFEAFLREGELVALTDHTITDPAEFRREMDRVRAQGYAIDDREHSADLRCIAVPVFNRAGRVIAAVSLSGPAEQMDHPRQEAFLTALRSAAMVIGGRLEPASAA